MKNITLTILENLIANEEYARKVLPFIKEEYFQDKNEKTIFSEIVSFATKYSKLPTKTSFLDKDGLFRVYTVSLI